MTAGRIAESALTCTVLVGRGRLLCQLGPLLGPCNGGIAGIQTLRHLFTDDIDKAFKGLLHVDVVLSAGLEELKTWRRNHRFSLKMQDYVFSRHMVTFYSTIRFIISCYKKALYQI